MKTTTFRLALVPWFKLSKPGPCSVDEIATQRVGDGVPNFAPKDNYGDVGRAKLLIVIEQMSLL